MPDWLQTALDIVHPARSRTQLVRSTEGQRAAAQAAGHLVLYHFASCPFCVRVRRTIHWLDLPIAMRDIRADDSARQILIEGGGRPTVPCLHIHDEPQPTWLYESDDIIAYLNRRFGPDAGP
ncbi:glutaredoxin [Salinisphaera sp. T31B1]|uniref:glutaredoxin family protein n=1 Tax=Salinisphaera sp. T31B1 TaxID=727963 RepID=UPI003341E815